MPTITLVRGDQKYFLEFEIRDADSQIVDITGSSITLKLQKYGESTLTLSKVGSILDGPAGLCQVHIATELVNKWGEYSAELEIRWPTGKILTAPEIYVKILKDLPR